MGREVTVSPQGLPSALTDGATDSGEGLGRLRSRHSLAAVKIRAQTGSRCWSGLRLMAELFTRSCGRHPSLQRVMDTKAFLIEVLTAGE